MYFGITGGLLVGPPQMLNEPGEDVAFGKFAADSGIVDF